MTFSIFQIIPRFAGVKGIFDRLCVDRVEKNSHYLIHFPGILLYYYASFVLLPNKESLYAKRGVHL